MGRTAPLPLRRIPGVTAKDISVAVDSVTNRVCGPSAGLHTGAEAVGVGLVFPSYAS